MRRLTLPTLVLLAAIPAAAQDINPYASQDRRAPPPPPPPPAPRDPDIRIWYEVGANASFEFLTGEHVSGNVPYYEGFYDATALDVNVGTAIAWVPRWGPWFHDAMFRSYVGWSYRDFTGQSFTDSTGLTVRFDNLHIETVYLGLTLGSGILPDEREIGFMGYVTLQLGAAMIEGTEVQSPTLFAGKQRFIKDTTNFYLGVGMGAEFMLERVSFRIEAGYRNFGSPRDGGSRIDASRDTIGAAYLMLGITFAF